MRAYSFACVTVGYLHTEREELAVPAHIAGCSAVLCHLKLAHERDFKLNTIDAHGQSAEMLVLCFELLNVLGNTEMIDGLLLGAFRAEKWKPTALKHLWRAALFLESPALRQIVEERVVYLRTGDGEERGLPRHVMERYPTIFLLHPEAALDEKEALRVVIMLPYYTRGSVLRHVSEFMLRTHERPFQKNAALTGSWVNTLSNMARRDQEQAVAVAQHANELGVDELTDFLMDILQKGIPKEK